MSKFNYDQNIRNTNILAIFQFPLWYGTGKKTRITP